MANEHANPYAPPKSDWVHAPSPADLTTKQWWIEGDTLVVLRGGALPADVCIKTGLPTNEPTATHKVQWVHPLVAISVISPIIFLILYLIFRKQGELSYAMSQEFMQRRKLGLALMLAPIAVVVLAAMTQNEIAIGVAILGFAVSLIVGVVFRTPFGVKKIDKERIYLKPDKRLLAALAARR